MDGRDGYARLEWKYINGDEKGEHTHVGVQGNTVIDYIIVNEECREEVEELRIGKKIDLDHMPLLVALSAK